MGVTWPSFNFGSTNMLLYLYFLTIRETSCEGVFYYSRAALPNYSVLRLVDHMVPRDQTRQSAPPSPPKFFKDFLHQCLGMSEHGVHHLHNQGPLIHHRHNHRHKDFLIHEATIWMRMPGEQPHQWDCLLDERNTFHRVGCMLHLASGSCCSSLCWSRRGSGSSDFQILIVLCAESLSSFAISIEQNKQFRRGPFRQICFQVYQDAILC